MAISVEDIAARFEYASEKEPITACPCELEGPGWTAGIEGDYKVRKGYKKQVLVACDPQYELYNLYCCFVSLGQIERSITAQS